MDNKIDLEGFSCKEIRGMIDDRKIDMASLDTAVLQKLMDRETHMLCLGKGDVDFISKCADIISERETELLSHDEFMAIVNKTIASQADETFEKRKAKRFSLKRVAIIAAALSVLIVGGTMVASALGFDLWGYISETVRQPNGTEIESNGITLYNSGEIKTYITLKEAVEKENLDIMYPVALPDGVTVESIYIADSNIGDQNIQILTKSNAVMVIVDTNVVPNDNAHQGNEVYPKDGVNYILFESTTEYKYGAYCNVDNCAYTIQAKKYEDLIFVIDNMKER